MMLFSYHILLLFLSLHFLHISIIHSFIRYLTYCSFPQPSNQETIVLLVLTLYFIASSEFIYHGCLWCELTDFSRRRRQSVELFLFVWNAAKNLKLNT